MKKKFMKFLIAASVITVFASFASLAASITIDSIDEVNTTTGDVKVSFTATDMAAADQVTALVFTPTAQNSGPVDTNIVYIDQNSNGTFSGKLNFKMKAGVEAGTDCTLLMGGTGVATAASKDFEYTDYVSGYNVSGTVSGVTVTEYTDPDLLEMMFGDKASTFGFTINLKSIDQSEILQVADVTYNGSVFTYTFPEKVKPGEYAVQIYKPGFVIRTFPLTVEDENVVIEDKNLVYGDPFFDLGADGSDMSSVISVFGTDIFGTTSASGLEYDGSCDYNGDAGIDGSDLGEMVSAMRAANDVFVYEEDFDKVDIFDMEIE
ncbi:MAG: hypothetical protein IKC41_06845 [Clostridia bacterium]|nr:hypothetical protein [Clostridia bacterium]